MENYDLEEDEVVLYKGNVALKNKKGETNLILTNVNFVFITKEKNCFRKKRYLLILIPCAKLNGIKERHN